MAYLPDPLPAPTRPVLLGPFPPPCSARSKHISKIKLSLSTNRLHSSLAPADRDLAMCGLILVLLAELLISWPLAVHPHL